MAREPSGQSSGGGRSAARKKIVMNEHARRSPGQGWPSMRRAALALALLVSGCAAIETPPPQNDVSVVVPAAAPRTTGIETAESAEKTQLAALFGGEYHDPQAETHLNAILAKLAAASDAPDEVYHVTILNSPIVNAFALPSGDLFMTRGLLALANDSSEVAAVMAHEIAHVTARHAAQRAELEKNNALISRAATVIQSRERGEQLKAYGDLTIAGFSRQQELDADRIGISTIAAAGYDPYGASRFLVSLGRSLALRASLMGQKSGDERPDLMSTHPSTPERMERAVAQARQFGAPGIGTRGRKDYLAAIDSIAFGDDPADGFVRGPSLIHPKLGFAFEAPQGFTLENTAQAVLGVADGGNQALRLDSVQPPASDTLESYLGSGWIEGLQQSSVESLTINGLPAATAVAKGGEWNFRLAVIRLDNDVYRLIFATRTLSPDIDQQFRDSIGSFHRITPAEAQNVHPLRISVVTARPGDTPDSLAGRMALQDRTLDHFLLLNGLDKTSQLTVGESYKLVVD
jgi:predicted Zn-dependent protease